MNDLIAFVEKNKRTVILVLAVLMFLFFAIFPVCDVYGKAKINGLKLIFNGKGIGFSRVIAILMLLVPVVIALGQLNVKVIAEKCLDAVCFIAAVVLFLIFALLLPDGVSVASGAYLYLFASVVGVAVTYLPKFVAKK